MYQQMSTEVSIMTVKCIENLKKTPLFPNGLADNPRFRKWRPLKQTI